MQLNITFRHVDPSDALKTYASDKVDRLKKYFDGLVEGHVILSLEKIRHTAEVTLQANGIRVIAKGENSDFYSAVDNVAEKLERQLVRYKEKLKRHKPLTNRERRSLQEKVYAYESFQEEAAPRILQTDHYHTHPMSLDDAVMEMELADRPFLVFTDDDGRVKVVYRREDGHYGLIEPE
ncbi:MAG: ribosome-associated translation inhibitor RaiA [Deltaproteobacteria bacterium]|nr:ribosome-associated translation inhibitor RaiA [Deltaproteobacteria bacterium]